MIERLNHMHRLSLATIFGCLLGACSALKTPTIGDVAKANDAPTLETLPAVNNLAVYEDVEAVDLSTVVENYEQAFNQLPTGAKREDIQHRLAHLNLKMAEQRHIDDDKTDAKIIYAAAIENYLTVIKQQREKGQLPDDDLLYSLAKAYDLAAKPDYALNVFTELVNLHPNSSFYSESQFRRGELLFSSADYRLAANAYQAVIDRFKLQDATTLQSLRLVDNAWYMLGWSDFKRGQYEKSLLAFTTVLDNYTQNTVEADLSQTQREIVDDTFRVVSLAFSHLNTAYSINQLQDELGEKRYADRLYNDLAALYLSKKRYQDSAKTYQQFIQRYPYSELAPTYHVKQIETYHKGNFPDYVLDKKQSFAKHYAIGGEYWLQTTVQNQAVISTHLKTYINELSAYYHNLAQVAKRNTPENNAKIQQHFSQAGQWYRAFVSSFPNDDAIIKNYLLLGETYFETADYKNAIGAYEMAAYGFLESQSIHANKEIKEQANEAAYAALLSFDRLLKANPQEDTALQLEKIESSLRFAQTFPEDVRRLGVLAQATQVLLSQQYYERTLSTAEGLLQALGNHGALQTPTLTPTQRYNQLSVQEQQYYLTGSLSKAHALMALQQYALAEHAYRDVVDIVGQSPQSKAYQDYYRDTVDNYAAAIYKQGEVFLQADQPEQAAQEFLRVVQFAPNSALRKGAQYDALVLLEQTAQWQAFIHEITDFQQRYPNDQQVVTVPKRLLNAYEQLEDWAGAATQALLIATDTTHHDVVVRQQALFAAAQLFEKAGDKASAILHYRDYAHTYPKPLADNMEAQFQLVELYTAEKSWSKRNYWLKKLIATHESTKEKTERSTYLAAFAADDLAEQSFKTYTSLTLTHPLKKSLAKKRKVMQRSIAQYEQSAKYGVELFTTRSTHRIGQIYATLATALMQSERPKGMSALELEQYNFLLEEQAYPFEESAIDFYLLNVERAWQGSRTQWVKASFNALSELLPARFAKQEKRPEGLTKFSTRQKQLARQ